MNQRQSLKAASERIEALEQQIADLLQENMIHRADTAQFYDCIEGTVDGESICKWCNDHEECQLQAKDGRGCKEWQHIIQQPLMEAHDEG